MLPLTSINTLSNTITSTILVIEKKQGPKCFGPWWSSGLERQSYNVLVMLKVEGSNPGHSENVFFFIIMYALAKKIFINLFWLIFRFAAIDRWFFYSLLMIKIAQLKALSRLPAEALSRLPSWKLRWDCPVESFAHL